MASFRGRHKGFCLVLAVAMISKAMIDDVFVMIRAAMSMHASVAVFMHASVAVLAMLAVLLPRRMVVMV